ncbi:acid protease [Choiromyces venosus 120613-1]|uniref:Probable aspartic-type endopeptidase OPSB n=1 Tax=Choiromyces venosus 120613-1 TaxID=1336337 RepID=A0A3N4K8I3_9PEZI|nr:acid protease [Choiromyces venosus 120613-1]
MKFMGLLCAALAFGGNVLAIHLHPRSEDKAKTLSFGFEKVKRNVENIPRLRKRSSTVLQRLDNADYLYYANVSIGTPPQNLRLHLDTGSSDVWVESMKSELCQGRNHPCNVTGTFDPDSSSTYEQVSNDFDISYVDGEFARGDYGKDVLTLTDGVEVSGLQFGIGIESTSTDGIMGIGFDLNEVQVQRLKKDPYRNLVDLMADQKLIRSRAYSLWLNDLNAPTGEILFGGVDTAKFIGSLVTVPIDKRVGETKAREFAITLTSVSITNSSGDSLTLTSNGYANPVLLDTGSTYTYLDSVLAKALADQVGAQAVERYGIAVVPCEARNYNGSVSYGFSGATITVPLRELVINAYDTTGKPAKFNDGTKLCYWGVLSSGDVGTNVMGDTFLRSAYVVYDLDNEEISLANTRYNATDSRILEIGAGSSAVPNATGVANAVTVLASGTGTYRGNSRPYISGSVTRPSSPDPTGDTSTAPSLDPSLTSTLLLFTTLFISLVL